MKLLLVGLILMALTGCVREDLKTEALEAKHQIEMSIPEAEVIIVVSKDQEDQKRQQRVMADVGYKLITRIVHNPIHPVPDINSTEYSIMYRPRKGHRWTEEGKHII